MDEDTENRVIDALSVVKEIRLIHQDTVRFHEGNATHTSGYRTNLSCVKQVGTILMSSERPTPLDCLRDPGQRIQRDHVPT